MPNTKGDKPESISRKLLRIFYKIWYYSYDGALFVHRYNGKFRVLYPDGQKSQPFYYKTAKDYAEIFGGKVIDNF